MRLAVSKAERVAGVEPGDGADRLAEVFLAAYAEAAGADPGGCVGGWRCSRRSASPVALRSWEKLKVARLIDVLRLMDRHPGPIQGAGR